MNPIRHAPDGAQLSLSTDRGNLLDGVPWLDGASVAARTSSSASTDGSFLPRRLQPPPAV